MADEKIVRVLSMKRVKFYFDYVSPYAWLAAHQLGGMRDSATFRFVPVLFAGLLDHHANAGPAEIPAKRRYTFTDAHAGPCTWGCNISRSFVSIRRLTDSSQLSTRKRDDRDLCKH